MKKLILTICLAFFSGGCSYIGFAGGYGGEFDSANFTVEYGIRPPEEIKSESGERDWMLTSGITIIDNAIDTWFFKSTPEMGGFLKIGIEVVPDTGFFANLLGGVTWIFWDTAWTERQTDWYGLIGGGLTYFINDKNMCLLATYDNRRGISGGIGFRF